MSYEKVRQANSIIIGTKQTVKAIRKGIVTEVVIAKDVEERIISSILKELERHDVKLTFVDSKKCLGEACGIEVGATVVAITL